MVMAPPTRFSLCHQENRHVSAKIAALPGVLQLEVPGVQPFRPFSGQGHRLIMEADKDPDRVDFLRYMWQKTAE